MSPRGYYQVLIIGGFYKEIDSIIPIFFIPTTGKSEYLYNLIFNDIKIIIIEAKININSIPKYFMIDFEIGLQKAVKNTFPNVLISGCFFHYVKILWNKAKSYGLCSKANIKHTKIFIFILKIIPYLNIDDRKKYFEELEAIYSNKENNNSYYKIIKYF